MANREAIRELQARLASRLQAVQQGANPAQWLAVTAGNGHYLLPLAQAGEIYALAGLQPVPHTKPWFRGVLNIRGSLFGIADLHGFLGGEIPPVVADSQFSVVTLNAALEVNCAIAVNALAGLRNIADFSATSAPDASGPAYRGRTFTDARSIRWHEINLHALSVDSGFLNIGA